MIFFYVTLESLLENINHKYSLKKRMTFSLQILTKARQVHLKNQYDINHTNEVISTFPKSFFSSFSFCQVEVRFFFLALCRQIWHLVRNNIVYSIIYFSYNGSEIEWLCIQSYIFSRSSQMGFLLSFLVMHSWYTLEQNVVSSGPWCNT